MVTESELGIAPLLSLAVGFFLGSIPFGLLVAKAFKVKDLASRGSGNIGATNVARVVGFWPAGAITLALDTLKGVLPVILVLRPGFSLWAPAIGLSPDTLPPLALAWAVGLSAVFGHCFSPWLNFRGGKGVATGLGVILVLSPVSAAFGVASFVFVFMMRRIGSLSSIAGLSTAALVHVIHQPTGAHLWFGLIMIWIILIRHQANIDALLEDRENVFRGH